MDTKKDWRYGKKTKTLLSKGKKNKGNINALRLKKVSTYKYYKCIVLIKLTIT